MFVRLLVATRKHLAVGAAGQQGAQIRDDHAHAGQGLRLVLHTAARNVSHLLTKTEISTLVLLFRS